MPADSEGARPTPATPDLPVTFRPLGVRIAAVAFGVMLFGVGAAIWISFPPHVREAFTVFQRLTVLGMGAGVLVVGHALARCRVDADAEGLNVVNGYRTHRLQWPQVLAVRMLPGNPWVTFDLADGTTLSALGVQGSDGARAQRQVRALRALIAQHDAREPDA
ncbi:PH domain-containing protein [Nocardioides marmoribigeumensis]|uniref:Low molecular weight protein antigen 6 PH domain-containing protein n=1 Tax=Nocardioides marmoribigeumensis TaxID=433649 RepID=A0ABU2BRS6_9ACTN|nr:PH domain-containing protein [Nocardioides marmoribigeumensis]MDR7360971.1 hypothetical protein [Nocardioides marmoribigeumensis]